MATDDTANDGIDLGWVTSSTLDMTVKHVFSGVAGGRTLRRSRSDSKRPRATTKPCHEQRSATAIAADDDRQEPTWTASLACPKALPRRLSRHGRVRDVSGDRTPIGIFKPGTASRSPPATRARSDYLAGYSLELSTRDERAASAGAAWTGKRIRSRI